MYFSKNDDTICAPATVPGTGAISIIRVSGKDALAVSDKVIHCRKGTLSDAPGYTIKFGTVCDKDGALIDEVLVSVFKEPHSYTGENSVEISCHASSYIVSKLIGLLLGAGARFALPGEFTQRAFLNGKMDLAQAEAVADVIASQNAAAHRIAFTQMKGGFSKELQAMRASLLEIVTLMELELDFSEEDVEFADRTRLKELVDRAIAHISRLIDSFKAGNAIKNGVPVAIAGATNTGKSTLLNTLVGEDRAIVSDIHGTTRDTIEETLDIDGVLFRFIDTAGLRETEETVEKIGIERTMKKISDASIVLLMADASRAEEEIFEALGIVLSKVDPENQKVLILVNKRDIVPLNKFVSIVNNTVSFAGSKGFNIGTYDEHSGNGKRHSAVVGRDDSDVVSEAGNALERKNLLADGNVLEENCPERNNCQETLSGNSTRSVNFLKRAPKGNAVEIIGLSAKTGEGIDRLKSLLATSQKDLLSDPSATLVTNTRHLEALTHARSSLERVRTSLDTSLPTDLISQDLRESLHHLGTITGEISTDEVLGRIFAGFCIGK